eukprot:Gb_22311 [translate_table: standard]
MPGMALARSLRDQKKKVIVFRKHTVQIEGTKVTLTSKTNTRGLKGGVHDNENRSSHGVRTSGHVGTLCEQGQLKDALNNLHAMVHQGISIDSFIYVSLLQGCINRKALAEGKLVHAHMTQTGVKPDMFLGNKLVLVYAKCGILMDARRVFDQMHKRNVVSWTVMIAAYARHGYSEEALTLFCRMPQTGIQPNQFTFASILPACANLAALEHGKEVHDQIIRSGFQSNVFVGSALVDMYVKCGSIKNAQQVFEKMPERNAVSWNAMISGYAQNGYVDDALNLFHKMPERDVISWNAMIAAYAQNGQVDEALNLFHKMPERNVVSWNSAIAAYALNGHVSEAFKLFEKMPERNVVSWTLMISGYAQDGCLDEALKLFQKMPERDVVSWTIMVTGYARSGLVDEALKLFQEMPERGLISWTAMVAGYAQNGHVDKALKLFQSMPKRNVISWNAIIGGYAQNGYFDQALEFFQQMQLTGMKSNSDTFSIVLPACANLAALEHGKEVHEDIIRNGFHSDVFVGNALVDMYCKCGSIKDACQVFDKITGRDVVSWTAMITGFAMHGCAKEALQLFEQMQQSGTNPDHVTFIGVLSACCHAGLVDDGLQYFGCMTQNYHIRPTMDHYCCMVDLLGRAGYFDELLNFINKMPIKPDASVWGSLLGACRIHMNIELGECVAEHLFELDPQNAAPYVLLSNMYASAGRWDGIQKVRKMMKDRRVKKKPGCSWIAINKQVHVFLVGD